MSATTEVQDRFVTLNGLRFHYREGGAPAAPAVVLLHGITGHARTWDTVAHALADQFRVLALDLRGHGESAWAPAYTYPLFAADVEQFVAHLDLEQFVLVGQSMGAEVAYAYAAGRPSRLQRLVLVDRGPGSISEETVTTLLSQIRSRAIEVFEDPQGPIQAAEAAARPSGAAAARDRAAYNLVQHADGRWRWRYDALGIANVTILPIAEQWAWLPEIRCPTFVVRGGESPVLSRESAEQMVRAIPESRWVEVPESGHSVHADNFAGFMAVVRPFLLDGRT